jgi:hypothetical protein
MSASNLSGEDRVRIRESIPPFRRPEWREEPGTVVDRVLSNLHGLASCLAVLGRADRTNEVGDELIDDALPALGYVMMQLAGEGLRARDEIEDSWGFWAEHRAGGAQ